MLKQEVGEPDPFRMRYRDALRKVVGEVVKAAEPDAAQYVADWTRLNIPADDCDRFISMAQRELTGLHEGNIARYYLRPSEFENWRKLRKG